MKRFDEIEFTGFQVSGDVLMQVDEIIGQVANFTARANGDNYISSGVEDLENGSYSDGYIVWNGEILAFQGGAKQEQVTIIETKFTATYQDGQNKGYYKDRYARFGTDGVETFEFNALKPVYARFANQFLNSVLLPYTGLLTDIPKGFAIADGTNETPNAGGRVFQSIGDGEGQDEIGTVGGNDYLTLLIENLPKHSHSVNDPGHFHGMIQDDQLDDYGEVYDTEEFEYDADSDNTKGDARRLKTTKETTGITLGAVGGSKSFDNRMAFIKGAYITWVGF